MKNRTLMAILPVVACFALLPGVQAVSPAPDGCYPNFTTAEGCSALNALTDGAGNTALGWFALSTDTDGSFNTAVGGGALVLNNGGSNTAVGAAALLLNTSGTECTAVGTDALVFNDSGFGNNGFGAFALENNVIGSFNNAHGRNALFDNTGDQNNAFGDLALEFNTTGSFNTAVGDDALDACTEGSSNVAIGDEAGTNVVTGTGNVYVGAGALGPGDETRFIRIGDTTFTDYDCFIAGINGRDVDMSTASFVFVDATQKVGTVLVDAAGNRVSIPIPQGVQAPGHAPGAKSPNPAPEAVKQAMLNLKVEKLQATVAQQQKQIEALTAGLQKVSAQLEVNKPAPKVVANKP
jgi:hypothetical protein